MKNVTIYNAESFPVTVKVVSSPPTVTVLNPDFIIPPYSTQTIQVDTVAMQGGEKGSMIIYAWGGGKNITTQITVRFNTVGTQIQIPEFVVIGGAIIFLVILGKELM